MAGIDTIAGAVNNNTAELKVKRGYTELNGSYDTSVEVNSYPDQKIEIYGLNELLLESDNRVCLDSPAVDVQNNSVININECPYQIGNGVVAYNSKDNNPTYDTMVPPVVSYRREYIGDISFNFSSSPATGVQLYDSSISQCRLYYAPIASTDIGETGGAIYSQNSDSLQDLKFRSVCSISIDGEDYDCTFSILKKLMHESDYHITCYICVISSAYPHNSFYRPVSDYYLPLAPDKRFVGILEVADSGQSPQYIVPNTSDWDGYISQGIDYYFPTDWFNSFGLLDFGRGIVSIKDGKIIKKTW